MEEYLTIANFADTVGVSKQAIYKRLDRDIAPYLKIINGKKHISITAFSLFQVETKVENPVETVDCPVEKVETKVENPVETVDCPVEKVETKVENPVETVDCRYLLSELARKDKIIDDLQQTISDQTQQIIKLEDSLIAQMNANTDILQQQTKLQENFQILMGQQQANNYNTLQAPAEPQKKQSFFRRLLGI